MKKNELINKTLAGLMIAAMTAGVCPTTAFAVTGGQVAKDDTYSKTVTVKADAYQDFEDYDVTVSLTVKDGKFTDITVTPVGELKKSNKVYFEDAYSNGKGFKTLLEGKAATSDTVAQWDTVSEATCTSKAIKDAATELVNNAPEAAPAVDTSKLDALIKDVSSKYEGAAYTTDSWNAFQAALTAADAALKSDSQGEIDKAYNNLKNAEQALVKKLDTSVLEGVIKQAESLKEADYTADSWKVMQDALTEAKSALEAKESQEKVDAAEAKLTNAIGALEKNAVAKEVYVLMNIPYDKFYAAEGVNDADAVTSATLNKTRTSLAAGSYHVNSDGSDITGVVYPVKVSDISALEKYTKITDESKVDITVSGKGGEQTKTYEGKDALFESASYSYYILSEAPSYYKEATVNEDGTLSFEKVKGTEVKTLSNVTVDFRTSSKYGDYQMNLSGLPDDITTVYGVVVGIEKGDSYGLRHVENIWKISKLAWSTGFVTTAHGNPLQYKHYAPMMGQTINKVTYYTNAGIYEIPMSVYVPVKADYTLKVDNADVASGEAKVNIQLPEGYDPEYSVAGLDNVKVDGDKLTYAASGAKIGKYTLTVTDKNKKYADFSTTFTLTTDAVPATFDADKTALVAAENYTEDDLAAYIKNIESVSVDGQSYAASGKGAVKIIKEDGSIDTSATPFKNAKDGQEFKIVVKATGYAKDYTFTYQFEDPYTYVYAALSYSEYWAAEGVQAAGSTEASTVKDTHNEYDKGAFDAVTRATTNHGLHRGNFQQDVTIYDTDGNTYEMAYWDGQSKIVLTDGTSVGFSRGTITLADGTTKTMDHYEITGIKYVPVKVAKADYDAFKEAYQVVENGGTLAGGYGEGQLQSYAGLVAEVTAHTNGLKKATKNEDGTFSFGERQTGTDSGIKDQALQTIDVVPVVQSESSYGDFIRVDIKQNYGEIGAKMQTVEWTYYGDSDKPLATFGTKFAADNWMHKSMGVQLGLTDSLRCKLPEGKDGTGKWTVTIYALGCADTTMEFNVTADDIHTATPVSDTSKLEAAIAAAEALNKADYTDASWSDMQTELKEAKDEITNAAKGTTSQENVDEATAHLNAAINDLVKQTYVLMNIPYSAFYKAEVNNDVDVDVFSSATLNKTRTASLSGGSYHTKADGSQIDGITFPVKVDAGVDLSKYTQVTDNDSVDITVTNRGKTTTTTYTGKDALYENADYAYYTLSEAPSYYKEVSVDGDGNLTFGKTVGDVTTLEGLSAELSTETRYGDYQLDIDGLRNKLTEHGATKINGVVINTKGGSSYGLRHLENIWKMKELAWSTGFTESVHGCPTSSAHYKAMMGQTITSVTCYTDKGMYNIPLADIYVPVKFTHDLEVANAAVTAGKTEATVTGLPKDYVAEYKVDGLDGVSVQKGVLTFSNAKKGKYTLTISDKNGKYADITTEFELYTEAMPAAYDADKKALVKTADAADEEFADYIKNITSVNVNGTDYKASGHGATVIINEDGSIKTDAAPFAEGDTFEITVSATGYLPQSFTYTTKVAPAPAEVNTATLEATIAKAEGLKEADYTADSWKAMQTELATAKAALEAKESQDAVDAAAASLQASIDALKAATPAESEDNKKDETESVDTAALEKVIATAKGLNKNDYTAATWTTMQAALTNAEKALEAKESQTSVDEAAKTLQAAIDGLKKASATSTTTDDKKNNNSSNKNNNNSNTNNNKNNTTNSSTNKNSTTSPKTGDPVSVMGLLGAAISSVGLGGLGLKLRKRSRKQK